MAKGITPRSLFIPVPSDGTKITKCICGKGAPRYWPCECGAHPLGFNEHGNVIFKIGKNLKLDFLPKPKHMGGYVCGNLVKTGVHCVSGMDLLGECEGYRLFRTEEGQLVLEKHGKVFEAVRKYEEWEFVPPLMANPEYYLSMVGKWDRGTSSTGPK